MSFPLKNQVNLLKQAFWEFENWTEHQSIDINGTDSTSDQRIITQSVSYGCFPGMINLTI